MSGFAFLSFAARSVSQAFSTTYERRFASISIISSETVVLFMCSQYDFTSGLSSGA
jgi:hypothetical protein